MFPVKVGSVYRVKRFTIGSRNSLKGVRKLQAMPDHVQEWLRQQSRDLYAAGFDTLVKRWEKCINVGGNMSRNECFPRFEYHMSYVTYPWPIYRLSNVFNLYGSGIFQAQKLKRLRQAGYTARRRETEMHTKFWFMLRFYELRHRVVW
jgi:hypothetical protein